MTRRMISKSPPENKLVRLARRLMVGATFRPVGPTCKAIWEGPFAERSPGSRCLVISRRERNFADATLSAGRTNSSCGEPGIYVDRDHHRGRDFERYSFDVRAQSERSFGRQATARLAGWI